MPRLTFICHRCKKQFERPASKSHLGRNKMWFCSAACCKAFDGQKRCGREQHGLTVDESGKRTAEFAIWQSMIARCCKPNAQAYRHYGGRGITVCPRWRSSLLAFLADVGPRPSTEYTLGRIDNDGNYEPGNVEWQTRKQQQNNTRWNHFLEFQGSRLTITQWSERIGISPQAIRYRLGSGWTIDKTLTTPLTKVRRKKVA